MEIFNNFWGIATLVLGAIVLVQLILSIINGTDLDFDMDVDGDADFDLGILVSPKGILHFLFGMSLYLMLIGKDNWDVKNYFIAAGVGLLFFGILAGVYYLMSKLQDEKKVEKGDDLVGRPGVVYLRLNGSWYEVTVTINGMSKNLSAQSKSMKEYRTGDNVNIIEYNNGTYYID